MIFLSYLTLRLRLNERSGLRPWRALRLRWARRLRVALDPGDLDAGPGDYLDGAHDRCRGRHVRGAYDRSCCKLVVGTGLAAWHRRKDERQDHSGSGYGCNSQEFIDTGHGFFLQVLVRW